MNNKIEETAKNFSLGKFQVVYPCLSDDAIWEVIGENTYKGKSEIVSNCEKTLNYFNSVETKFELKDIICENKKVVITGTAEFLKDGKRLNFVHASDFYEFNNDKKIIKISSYCISEK